MKWISGISPLLVDCRKPLHQETLLDFYTPNLLLVQAPGKISPMSSTFVVVMKKKIRHQVG